MSQPRSNSGRALPTEPTNQESQLETSGNTDDSQIDPLVLDVPSPAVTEIFRINDLVSRAESHWRRKVTDLVYPAVWTDGLTLSDDPLFAGLGNNPWQSLNEVVEYCAENHLNLWVDFALDIKPVRSELVTVKDFYGSSSSHACINSPSSQRSIYRMFEAVVSVTGKHKQGPLTGVVLSLQDLWPMGGRLNVIEPTCFCKYCTSAIDALAPSLLSHFEHVPNPWSLALRSTATGLDHIANIPPSTSAEQLVEKSRGKGFYAFDVMNHSDRPDESESLLVKSAEYLLTYMSAREKLTFSALEKITGAMREQAGPEIALAGIVTDFQYDWIGGYYLDHLARQRLMDELWMDRSNSSPDLGSMPSRCYLADRSRYYLQAFLEALESSRSERQISISSLSPTRLNNRIESARQRALAVLPTSVLDLELVLESETSEGRGAVVNCLTADEVQSLVANFSQPDVSPLDALSELLRAADDGPNLE